MGLLTVFAQNKGITMAMVEIRRDFSRKKDIIMVDTRHYMTFCKAPLSYLCHLTNCFLNLFQERK